MAIKDSLSLKDLREEEKNKMFDLNKQDAERVIFLLPKKFDAHDFIRLYIAMFPQKYVAMLLNGVRTNREMLDVTQVNKKIANDLKAFANNQALNIRRDDPARVTSEDILGNQSECSAWEKI